VQVDPITLTLKAPGFKRLKVEHEKLVSIFAFNFNVRRYNKATSGAEATYMESWGDSIVADHGRTAQLAAALGVRTPPVRIDSMAKYGALARQGLTLVHFSVQLKRFWSHLPVSLCLIDWGRIMHPT